MDLDSVADELYALSPQEFIATRNERVKQARASGDRELASAIGALRRPSTSAWVVNLLARERSDLIEQLLELADALRTAQETLSGPELRALSTQRHRVIASVVGEARRLAAAQDVKISDPIERELEATFDAALADPQAAGALRSGRLDTALSYAGLGAAPTAAPPPQKAPAKAAAKGPAKADPDAERRRDEARRAAEQAVRAAEADVERALAERDRAVAEHERAESERDDAQQRVADLTEQLQQAQSDAVAGANAVREQHRARSRAEHRAEEAHRRLERAREAAEKAGSRSG